MSTRRSGNPRDGADGVKSAARTLDLLETLAKARQPLSHSDLALRTGIPKSSLTELLRTLQDRHYIEALGPTGPFRIGPAARDLVAHGLDVQHIVACAAPVMEALSEKAGCSSGLYVLQGDVAERVHGVTAPKGLAMHEGVRAPLYACSTGKLHLAYLDAEALEAYLTRVELRPITQRSVRSVAELQRQLRQVRSEGVAFSQEEFTSGVVGFTAPIFNVHCRMVASIGLAVPTGGFEPRKQALTDLIKASAQAVSARIASSA
ncbi:MAG: IclR family transcriptional regulator [Hydrogenophaga sp.]|nr:IclR family transcriptional regulator [Hydrogenophaga sp.]